MFEILLYICRQFFRLVTGPVSLWYQDHSTTNPLGVKPDPKVTKIVAGDKFSDEVLVIVPSSENDGKANVSEVDNVNDNDDTVETKHESKAPANGKTSKLLYINAKL